MGVEDNYLISGPKFFFFFWEEVVLNLIGYFKRVGNVSINYDVKIFNSDTSEFQQDTSMKRPGSKIQNKI